MKSRIPTKIFTAVSIISVLLFLTLVSCLPDQTDKIDITPLQEVKDISGEGIEGTEEEIIEVVDYENAQIGAEIKGYIPFYLCTDSDNYIKIEITNTSDFTWKRSGEDRVRISYHYYGQDVEYTEYENIKTELPNNLKPGESDVVEVLVNSITNPGTYVLQIDPVLIGHFWFSEKGIPMLEGRVYFDSCTD